MLKILIIVFHVNVLIMSLISLLCFGVGVVLEHVTQIRCVLWRVSPYTEFCLGSYWSNNLFIVSLYPDHNFILEDILCCTSASESYKYPDEGWKMWNERFSEEEIWEQSCSDIRNHCDSLSALLDSLLYIESNRKQCIICHIRFSNMVFVYKFMSKFYHLCFILPLV